MLERKYIMIHHSLTRDSGTVSWGAIERYHIETNGWLDIGYHLGVELTGDTTLGRYGYQALVGRPEDQRAAACPQGNMNELAVHVCCVGNYDLEAPRDDLLFCLKRRILIPLMRRYNIPPAHIVGHRDYNTGKSCPGNLFDLNRLRSMVT